MECGHPASTSTVDAATSMPRAGATKPVRVELEPADVWRRLKRHTNEMAVGDGLIGRLLLPRLNVNISGLNPKASYWVALALQPTTQCEFERGKWISTKRTEDTKSANDHALYMHLNSPMVGSGWTNQTVSFQEVRLRHSDRQTGHLRVQLLQKYRPHILIFEGPPENWVCHKFPLQEAEFIAVKTYRNILMSSLKTNRHKKQAEKPNTTYTKCASTIQTEFECAAKQSKFHSGRTPSEDLNSSSPAYRLSGTDYQEVHNDCNAQYERLSHLASPTSFPYLRSISIVENPAYNGNPSSHHPQMSTRHNKSPFPTEFANDWPKKPAEMQYPLPITPEEPPGASLPFQSAGNTDTKGLTSLDMQLYGPPPPLIPIKEQLPSLLYKMLEESPPPLIPLKKQTYCTSSEAHKHDKYDKPSLWKDASKKRYYFYPALRNRCSPYATQNNQCMEKGSRDVHATYPYPCSYSPYMNIHDSVHNAEQLQPDGNANTFQHASDFPVTYDNTFQRTMPNDFYCQENQTNYAEGSHRDNYAMSQENQAFDQYNYERWKQIQTSCTNELSTSATCDNSRQSLTTLYNTDTFQQHRSTNKASDSDPNGTFISSEICTVFPCNEPNSSCRDTYSGHLMDHQWFQSVEGKKSSLEDAKLGGENW